ncbi:Phosphatidylserine decarboxylase [Trichoderma simmonsii]|uniref:Phosphatidylserine decarboxylase n=1 Tax=Trichoderma simmonsii TaxID=1491479 RepID=A0A8G0PML1_9HYPO|nr:Phosphatidylserine decarboxylase [Trichoderma simmonsii]
MAATQFPLPVRQPPFRRIGHWLPENDNLLIDWLRGLLEEIERDKKRFKGPWKLSPEVDDLKKHVESSAELRMLAQAMLDEVPNKPPYIDDPVGNKQIKSLEDLYICFDKVMTSRAPIWRKLEYDVGLVGFPFNAVLDWPMATPSGYAFFLKPDINKKFEVILNSWKTNFLQTPDSAKVLLPKEGDNIPLDEAWLSPESRKVIEDDTNLEGEHLKFEDLFECEPKQDYWGFQSWDDFFIRTFKQYPDKELRPIHFKDNDDWIINSCESKPFSLQPNAKDYDKFWLKGQPYSVMDMLNKNEDYASLFVGGTVYQAFLSATSYHRWDSPISGKVLYTEVIPGTYFAAPTVTGFSNPDGPDPASPDLAQGYITHFATRAVYYIANPKIGIIALLYVGMADVSSCEINEKFIDIPEGGVQVQKGEELGMFHHGGSTYCLLIPKGTKVAFIPEATPREGQRNIPIRSPLAWVYNDDIENERRN